MSVRANRCLRCQKTIKHFEAVVYWEGSVSQDIWNEGWEEAIPEDVEITFFVHMHCIAGFEDWLRFHTPPHVMSVTFSSESDRR